jgi:NADH dehydrogenase FAD-containing subunit
LKAQAAIQSGIAAAKNIFRQIDGKPLQPFRYLDRRSMIAIDRNAAGAAIG